jgi:hypothetical protein
LDSMEPILIRGGAYSVDGQEPGEVRPRSLEISEHCCPVDGGYDFSIALQDKGF